MLTSVRWRSPPNAVVTQRVRHDRSRRCSAFARPSAAFGGEHDTHIVWCAAGYHRGGVHGRPAPLGGGRLSGGRRPRLGKPSDPLEPAKPGRGFAIESNWPGLALVAVGGVLLLVAAAV